MYVIHRRNRQLFGVLVFIIFFHVHIIQIKCLWFWDGILFKNRLHPDKKIMWTEKRLHLQTVTLVQCTFWFLVVGWQHIHCQWGKGPRHTKTESGQFRQQMMVLIYLNEIVGFHIKTTAGRWQGKPGLDINLLYPVACPASRCWKLLAPKKLQAWRFL